jgi:transposase
MKMFIDVEAVYIHRNPVDFRKSINGLSVIVEQGTGYRYLTQACLFFVTSKETK